MADPSFTLPISCPDSRKHGFHLSAFMDNTVGNLHSVFEHILNYFSRTGS